MSRLSPAALAAFCFATMDDKDRAAIEKMNATDAREDQLVAAHDEWNGRRRAGLPRIGAGKPPRRNGQNSSLTRSMTLAIA